MSSTCMGLLWASQWTTPLRGNPGAGGSAQLTPTITLPTEQSLPVPQVGVHICPLGMGCPAISADPVEMFS